MPGITTVLKGTEESKCPLRTQGCKETPDERHGPPKVLAQPTHVYSLKQNVIEILRELDFMKTLQMVRKFEDGLQLRCFIPRVRHTHRHSRLERPYSATSRSKPEALMDWHR
jgi:hypothetical protein